jgi:hypothetical protein
LDYFWDSLDVWGILAKQGGTARNCDDAYFNRVNERYYRNYVLLKKKRR